MATATCVGGAPRPRCVDRSQNIDVFYVLSVVCLSLGVFNNRASDLVHHYALDSRHLHAPTGAQDWLHIFNQKSNALGEWPMTLLTHGTGHFFWDGTICLCNPLSDNDTLYATATVPYAVSRARRVVR